MPDGKKKYLSDVFHVPNITKNLVSIGQMVDQGLQVRFNPHGCFVEDLKNKGRLIAKGVKIMGEKEGVSLAAFLHTQWGNTHKGGG